MRGCCTVLGGIQRATRVTHVDERFQLTHSGVILPQGVLDLLEAGCGVAVVDAGQQCCQLRCVTDEGPALGQRQGEGHQAIGGVGQRVQYVKQPWV